MTSKKPRLQFTEDSGSAADSRMRKPAQPKLLTDEQKAKARKEQLRFGKKENAAPVDLNTRQGVVRKGVAKRDTLSARASSSVIKREAAEANQDENVGTQALQEGVATAEGSIREGELIFRLTYHQSGCRKPFDRLWISSMEDSAIREGFQKLKPSAQYDSLYHAALCRERADWIIGINATRLFSCLYGQPLAIGRVMTPTLGMTVQREAAIAAFVPEPFYTVQLCVNGMELGSKRFPDRGSAASLLEACKKEENVLIQSIERKERTEKAPELYDLTTLQRDANRILGFTAQQTLNYTQSLYEKKLVTYARSDKTPLQTAVPASDDCLCRSFSPGKAVQQSLWVYPQSTDSVPFRMRGLYGDLAAMESDAAVGNYRIALHFGVVWLRSDRNHI